MGHEPLNVISPAEELGHLGPLRPDEAVAETSGRDTSESCDEEPEARAQEFHNIDRVGSPILRVGAPVDGDARFLEHGHVLPRAVGGHNRTFSHMPGQKTESHLGCQVVSAGDGKKAVSLVVDTGKHAHPVGADASLDPVVRLRPLTLHALTNPVAHGEAHLEARPALLGRGAQGEVINHVLVPAELVLDGVLNHDEGLPSLGEARLPGLMPSTASDCVLSIVADIVTLTRQTMGLGTK